MSEEEKYRQAVEIVLQEQRASVSLLQRRLNIGYAQASFLIDRMVKDGILGDFIESSALRQVLISSSDWLARKTEHWKTEVKKAQEATETKEWSGQSDRFHSGRRQRGEKCLNANEIFFRLV